MKLSGGDKISFVSFFLTTTTKKTIFTFRIRAMSAANVSPDKIAALAAYEVIILSVIGLRNLVAARKESEGADCGCGRCRPVLLRQHTQGRSQQSFCPRKSIHHHFTASKTMQ